LIRGAASHPRYEATTPRMAASTSIALNRLLGSAPSVAIVYTSLRLSSTWPSITTEFMSAAISRSTIASAPLNDIWNVLS